MNSDGTQATEAVERYIDEVDLFMFSAALWLPHRIHYDRDFAHSDGHANLLVHGPLQIALLTELVADSAAREGRMVSHIAFRHHAPALVGKTYRLEVAEPNSSNDGQADIECATVDVETGITCTRGLVTTRPKGGAGNARS